MTQVIVMMKMVVVFTSLLRNWKKPVMTLTLRTKIVLKSARQIPSLKQWLMNGRFNCKVQSEDSYDF